MDLATTTQNEIRSDRPKKVHATEKHQYDDDDELDPDFYSHEHYNVDNLYKNRLHEAEARRRNESEFDRGLRLWECRSAGGIMEANEEARLAERKRRRTIYQERRYKDETA